MASNWRVTGIWSGPSVGFSETWYTGSIEQSAAWTNAIDLMTARDALVTGPVQLKVVRIVDDKQPRLSKRKLYPSGTGVADPGNPDVYAAAWLATGTAGDGQYRRAMWLKCIPDDWIKWSTARATWPVDEVMQQRFDTWNALLRGRGFCLKVHATGVDAPLKPVTALAQAALTTYATLTCPGHGISMNSPITVTGFKKPLSYLNGRYLKANVIDSNTIQLPEFTVKSEVDGYANGAGIRAYKSIYSPVDGMQLEYPSTRKVGRPFGERPGKSKSKR